MIQGEMQRQVAAATGKPGRAPFVGVRYGSILAVASATARTLSRRAIDSARNNDSRETAAAWRMNSALREAEKPFEREPWQD